MRGISSSHQTFIVILAALQSAILDHAAAPVNESAADDRLDEAMSAFAHDARVFPCLPGCHTQTLRPTRC